MNQTINLGKSIFVSLPDGKRRGGTKNSPNVGEGVGDIKLYKISNKEEIFPVIKVAEKRSSFYELRMHETSESSKTPRLEEELRNKPGPIGMEN